MDLGWGRDTPWRQGHILPPESLEALVGGQSDGDVAVVISDDCDLANDPGSEPNVEIIVCRTVNALDGNFTHAKNARKLHLSFSAGSTPVSLAFQAGYKITIAKRDLSSFAPAPDILLAPQEKIILQRWLAARYRRSAFPDEFDRRLTQSNIAKRLPKLLEPLGPLISAIYFDLDKGQELTRGADENYELFINILYVEDGDEETITRVSATALEIENLFREKFFDPATGEWKGVELEACEIVSDHAMSVAEANKLLKWNGDFLSLRADPQQHLLED